MEKSEETQWTVCVAVSTWLCLLGSRARSPFPRSRELAVPCASSFLSHCRYTFDSTEDWWGLIFGGSWFLCVNDNCNDRCHLELVQAVDPSSGQLRALSANPSGRLWNLCLRKATVLPETRLGRGSRFLPGVLERSVLLGVTRLLCPAWPRAPWRLCPRDQMVGKRPHSPRPPPVAFRHSSAAQMDTRRACLRELHFVIAPPPPRSRSANAGLSLPFQVDTLCLEDLHAFIAQALCLQGKSAGQLMDLQVPT